MASINVVLRTDKKPDQNGEHAIAIRVYHKKYMYYYLGIKVSPEHWNDRSGSVRASHSKCAVYNNIIDTHYERIDNGLLELEQKYSDPSPEAVKSMMSEDGKTDENADNFIAYFQDWIDSLNENGQHGYAKTMNIRLNCLKDFAGSYLSFEEITPEWVRQYRSYLKNVRGIAQTTTYHTLAAVRIVFRRAIKDGLANQADNPFFVVELSRGKPEPKTHLDFQQIRKIQSLNLKKGSRIWHARNIFMFSFWCAGIRISDICCLDWVDNINGWGTDQPELSYRMRKNDKQRVFPLLPPAVEILSYYEPEVKKIGSPNLIFPLIKNPEALKHPKRLLKAIASAGIVNNEYLGKIADRAGIKENITNHTSRHSFASCFEELGLPVEAMQELLAHSDMKTTEAYRDTLGVALSKRNRKSLNEFYEGYKEVSDG